ncbi:MAG TPA: DUF4186 domain-containing protein [Blastocatellia bacterium]|nr:DUF4186 domain-containing protein [Blastocatellia bacterium]HMX27686.1 DUF4186 domain-containing protein [Blastocatellia bacterium]HMY70873.1 DUF4186 domain-containing protein [Blastocatellia bacterium]
MRELDELFQALSQSAFRSRFHLAGKELAYLQQHGLAKVMEHAAAFIEQRLAPAQPANDGRQTPLRNHPVFIAQHATATCCRGCLQKWHGIAVGQALSEVEKDYVLRVLERWLSTRMPPAIQNNPFQPLPADT